MICYSGVSGSTLERILERIERPTFMKNIQEMSENEKAIRLSCFGFNICVCLRDPGDAGVLSIVAVGYRKLKVCFIYALRQRASGVGTAQ